MKVRNKRTNHHRDADLKASVEGISKKRKHKPNRQRQFEYPDIHRRDVSRTHQPIPTAGHQTQIPTQSETAVSSIYKQNPLKMAEAMEAI